MWIDRAFFLTSKDSTQKSGRDLNVGLCLICLVLSLTACAQQSDLVKVEKGLEGKISKLDQEKKALAQVLKQANQDIADARTALEQQKAELNEEIVKARAQLNEEIMKARAQLNSELRNLRDETLPQKIGDLDAELHQVRKKLETALQRQGRALSALKELREKGEAELSKQIAALGNNLEKALEQQSQKVSNQFAAFQGSLSQFKEALAGVNKQLDEEGKRAASAETKIREDFDRHLQVFRSKLEADTQALKTYLETEVKTAIQSTNAALKEGNLKLKTDIDAQAARLSEFNAKLGTELAGLRRTDTLHGKNLEEVTVSLAQLRDVLGTTGTQLGTKLDSQAKGVERTVRQIKQLQGQYAALAKKLDADMKGLHGYLEKDVRPSLESIAKAFGEEKNRVSQEFVKFKSGLNRVEQTSAASVTQAQTQLDAQSKHVQELGEAVAGMREVLDSMAGMLGNRTDQHMNQLGKLTARLEQLEKEQSTKAAKQASNTQAVSTHLNEVTASVQSIGESFEQFKDLVSTRLNEQADRLQRQAQQVTKSAAASSDVANLEQRLKGNVTQLNDLTTSVAQLKDAVRAMGEKLGSKVDAHEAQLLKGDTVRERSLNEVTASVQSIGESFEQFKDLVSTRLNEQADRLQAQAEKVSKTMGASSAVPNLQQGLKTNVTQLNDLTTSVAQLKEVVRAMGEKLGSKVDDHEAQLVEVEQLKEAINTVGEKLGSRMDAHEAQLVEVEQLKEAVGTVGEKLGSKVDAHESKLLKLEKAVNMFK